MPTTAHRPPSRFVTLGATLAVTGLVIALAVLTIATPIAVSTPDPVSAPGGGPASPPPASRASIATGAAEYSVTGDGPAISLEYAIEGNVSTTDATPLPWVKSTGAAWMSVTAQRGPGPGSITCRISAKRRVLAEHTGTGPYAVCTVSEVPD